MKLFTCHFTGRAALKHSLAFVYLSFILTSHHLPQANRTCIDLMLKYTQITWSWTVKSILLMVCVCIQSRTHFAFNFVVSWRFYICFQARGKVLIHSTSHYSSCLKLSVSSAEQITLSEALTAARLSLSSSLSLFLFVYPCMLMCVQTRLMLL